MTDVAKIGSTKYTSISAAFGALQNTPAPQLVEILTTIVGAEAVGAVAVIPNATVTISGVVGVGGALPELRGVAGVRLAYGKGIVNVEAVLDCTIQNLILTGARVDGDANGAGVRINAGSGITRLRNVIAIDNENGVLANGSPLTTIEDSLFERNGQSSNPSRQGYSHNGYYEGAELRIARSTHRDSQFGHDLKSRCKLNVIDQSLFSGAKQGRAFDCPNGGIVRVSHSVFSKNAGCLQNNLVDHGIEGITDGRPEEYIYTNCEFRNDVPIERDVEYINHHSAVVCTLIDPLFTGAAAAKDRAQTVKGNVKIVLTGGPLGPQKVVGRSGSVVPIPPPVVVPPIVPPIVPPVVPPLPPPVSGAEGWYSLIAALIGSAKQNVTVVITVRANPTEGLRSLSVYVTNPKS